MIEEYGVGADLDGEDGGEMVQPFEQPCFAVGEVAAGERVEPVEESAADASAEAVIDAFLTLLDVFAARQAHGFTPFDMSNPTLTTGGVGHP
jgi:hypothetical protein